MASQEVTVLCPFVYVYKWEYTSDENYLKCILNKHFISIIDVQLIQINSDAGYLKNNSLQNRSR